MLRNSSHIEASEMPEIPVNGEVLKWARAIRGLTIDKAAEMLKISPEELRTYEAGLKKPLVGFLRLMAQKYRVNFASLLMPEPLPIPELPADFRSSSDARPLTMKARLAIEEVEEWLDAFEDIADEHGSLVPAIEIGSASLNDDPIRLAERERKRFGISFEEQREWENTSRARNRWRNKIEERGVFTYMIRMEMEELSGFSILHDQLGAICVNDNEPTEGRKIFTLFHEYCHLLLRKAGISDENDSNGIEAFCNTFAGSFLVPENALRGVIGSEFRNLKVPHEFSSDQVRLLSRIFHVSNRAMAVRIEQTGLAEAGFYRRRTAPWDMPKAVPKLSKDKKKKISQIKVRLKLLGKLHAATVLEALEHRAVNPSDASEMIGLRPASFDKLKKAVFG